MSSGTKEWTGEVVMPKVHSELGSVSALVVRLYSIIITEQNCQLPEDVKDISHRDAKRKMRERKNRSHAKSKGAKEEEHKSWYSFFHPTS
jgi:hypothetical protein